MMLITANTMHSLLTFRFALWLVLDIASLQTLPFSFDCLLVVGGGLAWRVHLLLIPTSTGVVL